VTAVEEVLAQGVEGFGTEGAVGVAERRRKGWEEQMVLKEDGDGGVIKT